MVEASTNRKAPIMRPTTHRDAGFTLIELMIVMLVLGILAGIVIFAVGGFQDNADNARDDANSRICQTAAAAVEADHAAGGTKTIGDFAPDCA